MKLRILLLFIFFSYNASTSFAVIDIKDNHQNETTTSVQVDHFKKDKKSKRNWFQKRFKKHKSKNRKFRLRDLFQWKKKIKKAKRNENAKLAPSAMLSLVLAFLGSAILLLGGGGSGIGFLLFALFELVAFIFGFVGLGAINRNPEKLRGKGAAWAGIIISSIWAALISALIIWLVFFYVD